MATSSIKRYKMDHQKRGYLIIIDNHTFPNPKNNLYGSERDVENYKETFVFKLGFELVLRQNQTKNEMIKLMEHFANKVDHSDRDCLMVVFLSHGYTDEYNQQYICGVDDGVLLTKLTDPFITCHTLENKPKIFFCDVCRGSKLEPDYAKSFVNDSKATPLTAVNASRPRKPFFSLSHFLFGYGSAHGYVAGKIAFKKSLISILLHFNN
jgi:hypothetical protein